MTTLTPPWCHSCGTNLKMVLHGSEWKCHGTHVIEDPLREAVDHVVHSFLDDPMDMNGMYAMGDKVMKAIAPFVAQPINLSTDSPTPRTDEAKTVPATYPNEVVERWWVTADFARQLERELREATNEASIRSDEAAGLAGQLREARAALNIALTALEDIRISTHCISKAGLFSTPTLQEAWSKCLDISTKAANAIGQVKAARDGNE